MIRYSKGKLAVMPWCSTWWRWSRRRGGVATLDLLQPHAPAVTHKKLHCKTGAFKMTSCETAKIFSCTGLTRPAKEGNPLKCTQWIPYLSHFQNPVRSTPGQIHKIRTKSKNYKLNSINVYATYTIYLNQTSDTMYNVGLQEYRYQTLTAFKY